MAKKPEPEKLMTKEEWVALQLANAPEPTAEDVWWVLNRFGFPQEQVEAAYEAMLREKEERARASSPKAATRSAGVPDEAVSPP